MDDNWGALIIWIGAPVGGILFIWWEIRMASRSGYMGKRK